MNPVQLHDMTQGIAIQCLKELEYYSSVGLHHVVVYLRSGYRMDDEQMIETM